MSLCGHLHIFLLVDVGRWYRVFVFVPKGKKAATKHNTEVFINPLTYGHEDICRKISNVLVF